MVVVVGGRPDVMKLIKEAYYSWGAEVVFITSNPQGNREMMEGCKQNGIPAFVRLLFFFSVRVANHLSHSVQGTLWDF